MRPWSIHWQALVVDNDLFTDKHWLLTMIYPLAAIDCWQWSIYWQALIADNDVSSGRYWLFSMIYQLVGTVFWQWMIYPLAGTDCWQKSIHSKGGTDFLTIIYTLADTNRWHCSIYKQALNTDNDLSTSKHWFLIAICSLAGTHSTEHTGSPQAHEAAWPRWRSQHWRHRWPKRRWRRHDAKCVHENQLACISGKELGW